MTRKTRIITLALATSISAAGLIARAGDLNPPPGPVGPTMKTLSEVEARVAINATNTPGDGDSHFKITQPGSYYLTGNVTGVAAKHGIEIDGSGVTLDLGGFDLLGVAGSLDGVSATAAGLTNIAVVNGSIRNWGDEGVDLASSNTLDCRVEGVLASGNAGVGIGIGQGTVSNCSAYQNTAYGIITNSGSTITNCSAYFNTQSGFYADYGSMVSHCSGINNGGRGIFVSNGCTVTDSSARANTLEGIMVGSGCAVSNCTAYQNTASGIRTATGCTVTGCTVYLNTLDGIECSYACVIRGNTCSYNGNGGGDGAGIHIMAADNHIEGNNCTGADRGIDVDSAGNIIIKNTCANNTVDWAIVASNVFGPIIDRRAPASAAVSGFSAASSLGSTDANANFSY
ncbi:MAG TPA: right-handed parallel beta-helix repeat-containing protein [Phycisphaerae bacterium]|nr:right-handed parallel beta-helix repeat-containing protein [Phycisphaerae bacterium]